MMKFAILAENKSDHSRIKAEWGLSVFIEAGDKKILFDAGSSAKLFAENAERMHIDLSEADFAVASHGHYDHTNGFPEFARLNDHAPIYIHEKAFGEVYGSDNGIVRATSCSIEWTPQERKELENRLIYTNGPVNVTDDIIISGTVPLLEGETMQEVFYEKKGENEYVRDDIAHEQILVIRDRDESGASKGVYVFAGCCHRGAVAALRYAKSLMPGEKIKCFLAGTHLCTSPQAEINRVTAELEKEFDGIIMPVHCTGLKAICYMSMKLGNRCIPACAGDRYEF